MSIHPTLQNIRSLHLNPNGADVWFIIHGERIPGHKLILGASCPYYKTMFYGSLPEDNDIDMTASNTSAEAFKEFLKFMYGLEPNLTADNIEGVISMAKQSLSQEILAECESFLTKSLTTDTIFWGYQLAILYDLIHLKELCEDEICIHAEEVLQSSSFLQFPYDFLQTVMQRDALACEEVDIFFACIAWAKHACKRKNLDDSNVKNIRDQLQGSVHQIRFTSMTKEEVGKFVRAYPGLFTAPELEEIICMVARQNQFTPKQFNWTPRYFNLEWHKGHRLQFSLLECYSDTPNYKCKLTSTVFFCTRRTLLKEVFCEINVFVATTIRLIITEYKDKENTVERYNQRLTVDFNRLVSDQYGLFQAKISLSKAIFLRPKYIYEIRTELLEFELLSYSQTICHYSVLSRKTRVDHDIVIYVDNSPNGIVTGLTLYRFDNKNYFQKIMHNPKSWLMVGVGGVALLLALRYFGKWNVTKVITKIAPLVPADTQLNFRDYKPIISFFHNWI